ncbi:diacylglycerol kinase family lipid kinase [Halobacillus shinanisalinarum]|uniref:Diacylglycerol kinase family lipid kinase n=1 Tax=Halobacillus shinanisalinarum TaxID=2932258 RepID=A0ABY4GUC0_9BACI|nr:diacylglycerol kinase family protein [Halobacillus shinanisalinarum]UOQ91751.1 diacylglycerol kinase family lipid kinase [Halobacillus shinanisalinarum]
MKAMLIVNPSSGKEEAVDYVKQIEAILQNKGYEIKTVQTEKEFDATKFCQNACQEKFDLIVSLGGDGTLNETINGLVDQQHRPKLGIIPLGTVNDFARALQIPLDPEEAIKVLQSDLTKKVDVGRFNDQYFVNIVAVGALAEASYDVTPEQKTKFGTLAYVVEGLKTLASTQTYPLRIEHDEKVWEGDSFLFLAALTNSTAGFEKLSPQAKVNDGLLHCYIIENVNMIRMASIASSMVRGELRNQKDVEYFTAGKLNIASPEDLVTNVDGEEGDRLPVSIEVKPQHIEVIID